MGMVIADAKPVVIGMKCDACGEGMMEPVKTGFGAFEAIATNPPLYKHRCTKCGAERMFTKRYPNFQFVYDDRKFREITREERETVGVTE